MQRHTAGLGHPVRHQLALAGEVQVRRCDDLDAGATLHSIAVGNLLPAWVKVACVDISPATVTKLMDRGTTQTVGIVSDAEPFLRALVAELAKA